MSNSNVVQAAARIAVLAFIALALVPASVWAQGRGVVNGTISDPSEASVPDAEVILLSLATGIERTFVTSADGFYAFPDALPGNYSVTVSATGFRTAQTQVSVRVNQSVRADLQLELGATTETVTITATTASINFEDATQQGGIAPEVLQDLPLLLGGGPRRASDFVLLVPGASTGGTDDGFTARFNGGLQAADEALMDGISMIQGTIANNGMIAFEDFAVSPEMVSEVKVLTSNYEPQYGSTNSAVIQAQSKSGTNEYHGGLFWYHFNTALNARQYGSDEKGKDIENNWGGALGGPVPGLGKKTFFYYLNEQFRIRGGGIPADGFDPVSQAAPGRFHRLDGRRREHHSDLRSIDHPDAPGWHDFSRSVRAHGRSQRNQSEPDPELIGPRVVPASADSYQQSAHKQLFGGGVPAGFQRNESGDGDADVQARPLSG